MAVRPFLVFLLLLATVHPAGALWREFALASDRSNDPVILDLLEDATLDERLEILAAVGERADPFIGAYLDDFLLRHTSRPAESEHLMRVLLASAFPRSTALDQLAERVAPNQAALLAASARLATFVDPQLCAAIVRLIPLLPGGLSDLLGIVDRLVNRLGQGDGFLDPRDDGLLLDALEAMGRIGSPDFLEPALAVARLSRERIVVERSRAVARALALDGTGR
ncbi:MAG: hypothetical protein NTU62_09165 [Spirochaetes bacterium]|nr:hypothetical protein [Spirochaetota bacterium]